MTAIVGETYALTFTFFKDGEFFSPDDSSVVYTILDNSGTPVVGSFTEVEVDFETNAQSTTITIAAGAHTLTGSNKFEQRTCVLYYEVDEVPYTVEQYYYVTERRNVRVSPESVVARLGLKIGEINPNDIDLLAAYIAVDSRLEGTVLDDALTSAGEKQINANRAIQIRAAIDLATAIELKTLQKAGGDIISFSRFQEIDFTKLRESLFEELQSAMGLISSNSVVATYAIGTTGVDAITGV